MDLRRLAQNARTAERNRRRMALTGLTPSGHPLWAAPEPQNLASSYPDYRAAMELNQRRTLAAHYGKASREGIARDKAPTWTDPDVSRLRRLYPRAGWDELQAAFPGRSRKAIQRKALKLRLFRPQRPHAATGILLLDALLARAREKRLSLADLDHIAARRNYFVARKWRTDKRPLTVICRVIEHMGGTIRAHWEPDRGQAQ